MSKKTKPAVQPKPQEKTEQPGNTPVTSAGQPEVENTEGAAQDAPEKTSTGDGTDVDSEARVKQLQNDVTDTGAALKANIEHLKKVAGAVRPAHAMMKRAREVFNMYPGLPECYFTADETAFTERQHAVMHGQNLGVSEVITIKRSEV
jgi:hypothetical protein